MASDKTKQSKVSYSTRLEWLILFIIILSTTNDAVLEINVHNFTSQTQFGLWDLYWKSFLSLIWHLTNQIETILYTGQWFTGVSPVSCRLAFSLRTSTPLRVANNSVWRPDRTSPISPESDTPFHRLSIPSKHSQLGRTWLWYVRTSVYVCLSLLIVRGGFKNESGSERESSIGKWFVVNCVYVWEYAFLCALGSWTVKQIWHNEQKSKINKKCRINEKVSEAGKCQKTDRESDKVKRET